jgi:hypothetical protein
MEQTQTNKRCEFFQNIQHTKLTFCIEGSDMQITATLFSNERDRTITASFFFDSQKCPVVPFGVGDELRLIGTHLQKWNSSLQLTGKTSDLDTLWCPCLYQMQLKLGNMLLVNSQYCSSANIFQVLNDTFPNSH